VSGYQGKNILITGGLGFIGSNLALKLVDLGAQVTLLDAMIPGYGGNLSNIDPIKKKATVNFADVRDEPVMDYLVRDRDVIFHLAAQVSHVKSLTDPFPDIDINIKGTAILLEACKKHNPRAVIIRTGTRGQYGPAVSLPVAEDAPREPKGIYEISQQSAEEIARVYHQIHGLRSVNLRLTNIYGPRAQMHTPDFGVVNWFVRQAIDHKPIKVFGDGRIKRDFLYVDDCVAALIAVGSHENCYGQVFNVGHDRPSNFLELAELLCRLEKGALWEFAPFTPERAAQEPGDFASDIRKIGAATGWKPKVTLEDGLKRTLAFYSLHKKNYWHD
jgi:UDP-glucose 4-epimerase